MRILISIIFFCIFLIPSFVNLNSTHNWGSDFAQYIHQSKNIVEGLPQEKTYLYNPGFSENGPQVYPVGFPLLLAPIYFFYGNNILIFSIFISFCLFILNLLIFYFFKKRYGPLYAILLAIIFAYDPWMLSFKQTIVSDIPFTLFAFITMILFFNFDETKNRPLLNKFVILIFGSIFLAMTILTRTIGVAFIPAMILFVIYKYKYQNTLNDHTANVFYFEKFELKENLKNLFIIFLITFILIYIVNNLIFNITAKGNYSDQITFVKFKEYIYGHIFYYIELIKFHWSKEDTWRVYPNVLRTLSMPALIIGIIVKIKEKRLHISDFFCSIYMLILIMWPPLQEWRFILPIAPFIYEYYFEAIKYALKFIRIDFLKYTIIAILIIFVTLTYSRSFYSKYSFKELFSINNSIRGPNSEAATKLFDYIKKNTPEDATFVFTKPRALALYAGRKRSMIQNVTYNINEQEELFNKKRVCYFIEAPELHLNNYLSYFLEKKKSEVAMIYEYEKFKLYRYEKSYCK
ncbi:MAG: phospholipid carrier-dependent glycosyltransferase [Oligoflexia bacterium]|nr:phospholipid carrier-dependent glycosyltransferase [Oligoflexia bacterium]